MISQASPSLLVSMLPQFNIESVDNAYPRLVGILFLMLGLARLHGALFFDEKGAVIVSMWSWVIELIYTLSELFRGQFLISENVLALVFAPLMLLRTLVHYRRLSAASNALPSSQ